MEKLGEEKEDFLVGVLRRRSAAQLRARRRNGSRGFVPIQKKNGSLSTEKKKEKHSFSSAPCRDGSLSPLPSQFHLEISILSLMIFPQTGINIYQTASFFSLKAKPPILISLPVTPPFGNMHPTSKPAGMSYQLIEL